MNKHCRGFTLIELLVTLGIFASIAAFAYFSMNNSESPTNLSATAEEAVALLGQAQSRSELQYGGSSWGVHFDNSTSGAFFAFFSGNSYNPSKVETRIPLPYDICYGNINTGSSTDVIFNEISGSPTVETSTNIEFSTLSSACGGSSTTVSVSSQGAITY